MTGLMDTTGQVDGAALPIKWELLASPLRLQATPQSVGMPLGPPHHGTMA